MPGVGTVRGEVITPFMFVESILARAESYMTIAIMTVMLAKPAIETLDPIRALRMLSRFRALGSHLRTIQSESAIVKHQAAMTRIISVAVITESAQSGVVAPPPAAALSVLAGSGAVRANLLAVQAFPSDVAHARYYGRMLAAARVVRSGREESRTQVLIVAPHAVGAFGRFADSGTEVEFVEGAFQTALVEGGGAYARSGAVGRRRLGGGVGFVVGGGGGGAQFADGMGVVEEVSVGRARRAGGGTVASS